MIGDVFNVRVVVELGNDRRNDGGVHVVDLRWPKLTTVRDVEISFARALAAVKGLPREGQE
jgi:hypothetical protein